MKDLLSLVKTDLRRKRVLVRVDLNIPKCGEQVEDASRIEAIVPTIKRLFQKKAKIIILSHLGRPKQGTKNNLSLSSIIPELSKHLSFAKIIFCKDCIGTAVSQTIQRSQPNEIILLENLRFHDGEEKNDQTFARLLSKNGDIYVNDAFSVSHRQHASVVGITKHLPAFAGLSLKRELHHLDKILKKPKKPSLGIIGGSKISTKIGVIKGLTKKLDYLIIGGGMANTFIFNQGIRIGKSLYEKNTEKITSMINNTAKKNNCEILLPIDFIVTTTITKNGLVKRAHLNNIPDQHIIADIGPKTIKIFAEKIKNSKTILWNGPLGIFEIEPFNKGTYSLAKKVAKLTKENKMESIAGGGDTISAIIKAGVAKSFTYTSLAGGAFLEWLEGKELPGIKALRINKKMI